MFFGNVLAAAYKTYGRFKNEEPYFSAIIFLITCQLFWIFLVDSLLKKFFYVDLIILIPKLYFVILLIVWMLLALKYYTKDKVNKIILKYNEKSIFEKRIWGIIALAIFLVPIIIILLK